MRRLHRRVSTIVRTYRGSLRARQETPNRCLGKCTYQKLKNRMPTRRGELLSLAADGDRVTWSATAHADAVTALYLGPRGLAFSGSRDGSLAAWHFERGELVELFRGGPFLPSVLPFRSSWATWPLIEFTPGLLPSPRRPPPGRSRTRRRVGPRFRQALWTFLPLELGGHPPFREKMGKLGNARGNSRPEAWTIH
jgi:hypothetical protein